MMKSSCPSAMGYMAHCCFKWCQMNLWIFFSAFAKVMMSFFAICFFTMCFLTLFAKVRMCCTCCKLTLLHNYLDFSCFENIMEDFPFQLVHLLSSLIVFCMIHQILSMAWCNLPKASFSWSYTILNLESSLIGSDWSVSLLLMRIVWLFLGDTADFGRGCQVWCKSLYYFAKPTIFLIMHKSAPWKELYTDLIDLIVTFLFLMHSILKWCLNLVFCRLLWKKALFSWCWIHCTLR